MIFYVISAIILFLSGVWVLIGQTSFSETITYRVGAAIFSIGILGVIAATLIGMFLGVSWI